ncbi:metal-dependent hydrolase [Aquimarina intermedia]|uniref:Inner membrane protein n=1 Tax=Aquimarina intermedia TaxID=350814 RepID=A0A5S5C1F3_9FLAO|nr:metal-dependent hydrolase [Aquimarina intermedia]TYP72170.1 inner membrane protein [Aquimarina intermedia]
MDSLTQIVLGAAVGELALGKKIGNKAILWGAIAGTIPDLDVITKWFFDPVRANELHRGFSHSILFSLLAAPLLGWVLAKLYKNSHATWRDWTLLMFLGLFTHPLLDAFTTWGTQLFWPSPYKVSFKSIFVIDPLYTLPFLLCVVLAMRLKRENPKRRYYAKSGLIISSCYLVLTVAIKGYTYSKFEASLIAQNIEYLDIQTKPTPFNSILWTANVQTADAYHIGYYSIFDRTDTIEFSIIPKNHHLLGASREHPLVERLIKLTEGWYTIDQQEDSLLFNDLRFGQLDFEDPESPFVFSYELYYNDNELHAKEPEKKFRDGYALLKKLFNRMGGI